VNTNGNERRCSARTKAGEQCKAIAGADGLCTAHRDPERMRELGRQSVRARAKQKAERIPESLRARLREQLDPAKVQAAIEQSLAGGNESARVQAVRFLADLELYKADSEDARLREYQAHIKTASEEFTRKIGAAAERSQAWRRHQLREILEPLGLAKLAGEDEFVYDVELEIVRELARRLAAIPAPIRKERAPAS
jgi:hypothetical protein